MDLRTGADIQLYFKVKNLKYNDFTEAYKRLPRPDFYTVFTYTFLIFINTEFGFLWLKVAADEGG